MKSIRSRVTAILAGWTLMGLSSIPAAHAQTEEHDLPDEYREGGYVCPDGRYQSGCDMSDIDQATQLENAQPADFAERCLYRTAADCAVIANGRIARFADGRDLHWQLLSLQPADGPYAEMLVLVEVGGSLPYLLLAKQVDGYFDPPLSVRDDSGRFVLHVPARNRGFGNADIVLFTSGEGWNWTTAAALMRQVDELLPQGFTIASPVSFNFRESAAFAPIRRDGDAGCCATGGTVVVDFEQSDHNLSVSRVNFIETTPVGQARVASPASNSHDLEGRSE